jgi:hypothetical protein
MKRLLRVLLTCFIALAMLCAAAVFVGRRQSEPTIIEGLQACGDSWCFLGILPGTTPFDAAMKIIGEYPALKAGTSDDTFDRVDSSYSVQITPAGVDKGTGTLAFGQIAFLINEPPIPLGNMMSIFGPPCYVVLPNGSGLSLIYLNGILDVSSSNYSVTPQSLVTDIEITESKDESCANPDDMRAIWRGFRDYSDLQ